MNINSEAYIAELVNRAKISLENDEVAKAINDLFQERVGALITKQPTLEDSFKEDVSVDRKIQNLISLGYYLELVGIHLILKSHHEKLAEELLYQAAETFEYVGRNGDIKKSKRNLVHLHSSLCYGISDYTANSIVMARKLLDEEDTTPIFRKTDELEIKIKQLILLTLARRFKDGLKISESLIRNRDSYADEIKILLREREIKEFELARYYSLMDLLNSFYYFFSFVNNGRPEDFKESLKHLSNSRKLLLEFNDAEYFSIVSSLEILFKKIHSRSIWENLKTFVEKFPKYLKTLTNSDPPIFELWPSQMKAIENGLLDDDIKRIVVSMPTSAGKTLIAEFSIVNSLIKSDKSTAVYVAPNKALAAQVEEDLADKLQKRLRFKVSLLVGSYDTPEIEKIKLKNCRLLITTPEKFNYLFKKGNKVIRNAEIFIFDESHQVGSGTRGLQVESIITRLKCLFPERKILLLSAVMSNSDEITRWLGGKEAQKILIDWHPTRILPAIIDQNGYLHYYLKNREIQIKIPFFKKRMSQMDRAIELAFIYFTMGTTFIFADTKKRSQEIIKKIYEKIIERQHFSEDTEVLDGLSNLIADTLGEDFPLAQYVKKGVAYHHADLPLELRREIEKAIRSGHIRIVSATTTLAEGVNFPISCVIFPYLYFMEKSNGRMMRKPVTSMLFRNIAGRAGRALRDTEGHVILILPNGTSLRELKEKYIISDIESLEKVKSVFSELEKIVDGKDINQISNNEFVITYQSELLASLCDGLITSTDEISSFLNKTLFGVQCKQTSKTFSVVHSHTHDQLLRMKSYPVKVVSQNSPFRPTEFGHIINKTGISPESCSELYQRIETLLEENKNYFNIKIEKGNKFIEGRLKNILKLAFVPYEVRSARTFRHNGHEILFDWIFGESERNLAEKYFYEENKEKMMFEAFSFIIIQLTYYAPWTLWALNMLLDYKKATIASGMRLLPAFAKYGVNNQKAVYISSLGIEDREVSMKLSKFCPSTRFEKIKDWLFGLTQEELNSYIGDRDIALKLYNILKAKEEYFKRITA